MLLGILSDTHGNVDSMRTAMQLLQSRGAEFYIHCGDVGSEQILDFLTGHPAAFVFGNCDWERDDLQRYAEKLNVQCCGVFGDLTLDGKKIAFMHGDDAKLKQRILSQQTHDYLLQGHTHTPDDTRIGRTRLINPGALHRANPRSAAILDLAADQLQLITVR